MDDKIVKKALRRAVSPLVRRREHRLERARLARALALLDERASGEAKLASLRDTIFALRRDLSTNLADDPNYQGAFIALARALLQARRISKAQYVYFAASSVERLHEGRWMNKIYDKELQPIMLAMNSLRAEHGLGEDEEWFPEDEPVAYNELNLQYEAILDQKLSDTFHELELNDLAQLRRTNLREYDRLRERGRRFFHHGTAFVPALSDYIIRCEQEAQKAASGGAYFAAVAQLGAGLEGLLLKRCMRSQQKAVIILGNLPRRMRQRAGNDITKWSLEVLIEVCEAAGWLPRIDSEIAEYIPRGLAHYLRSLRNLLHPARHADEQPWQELYLEDYDHAHAVYTLVLSSLSQRRKKVSRSSVKPST